MQIPLFKRLSDMDSNYSQLIYVAVGRKRNSNTWQFNQEDEKIPGFIEFYDQIFEKRNYVGIVKNVEKYG